jgi:hypothetical protein
MKCALKIQRFFARRAKGRPADEALIHRIGIHLGDIFATEQDVMGDGVNIAARLQAVADPGGICISQTVYDVVKNKLEFEVERLNPRNQKNISEIGPLYRVLLEPRLAGPVAEYRLPDRTPRAVFSRTEKLVVFGLLVLGLAAVARQMLREESRLKASLTESHAAHNALDALLTKKAAATGAASSLPEGAGATAADKPEEYHFAEMTLNPAAGPARTEAQDALIRLKADQYTGILVAWIKSTMHRYTKDEPLLLRRSNAQLPDNFKVFTDAKQRLVFARDGATRTRDWDDLGTADQEALIVSLLLDSISPPPRDVLLGADAFAYLHHRPEMVTALHPGQK